MGSFGVYIIDMNNQNNHQNKTDSDEYPSVLLIITGVFCWVFAIGMVGTFIGLFIQFFPYSLGVAGLMLIAKLAK